MKMPSANVLILYVLSVFFGVTSLVAAKELAVLQGTVSVRDRSKSEHPSLAKVSIQTAIEAATQLASGKVIEVSLEDKDGFLVYEVEIQMPDGKLKELFIDAGTGKILFVKEKNRKHLKENDDKDED